MNLKFEFASLTQGCYKQRNFTPIFPIWSEFWNPKHIFSLKIVTTCFPNSGFWLTGCRAIFQPTLATQFSLTGLRGHNPNKVQQKNAVWTSRRSNVALKLNLIKFGSAHEWSGVWNGPRFENESDTWCTPANFFCVIGVRFLSWEC